MDAILKRDVESPISDNSDHSDQATDTLETTKETTNNKDSTVIDVKDNDP